MSWVTGERCPIYAEVLTLIYEVKIGNFVTFFSVCCDGAIYLLKDQVLLTFVLIYVFSYKPLRVCHTVHGYFFIHIPIWVSVHSGPLHLHFTYFPGRSNSFIVLFPVVFYRGRKFWFWLPPMCTVTINQQHLLPLANFYYTVRSHYIDLPLLFHENW